MHTFTAQLYLRYRPLVVAMNFFPVLSLESGWRAPI